MKHVDSQSAPSDRLDVTRDEKGTSPGQAIVRSSKARETSKSFSASGGRS